MTQFPVLARDSSARNHLCNPKEKIENVEIRKTDRFMLAALPLVHLTQLWVFWLEDFLKKTPIKNESILEIQCSVPCPPS